MNSGVGMKRSLEDMSNQGRPPPPSHASSRDDKSESSNSADNGLSKRMERKRRTEKMRRQEMNERWVKELMCCVRAPFSLVSCVYSCVRDS